MAVQKQPKVKLTKRRSKFLLGLIVVIFAGVGTYLLTNSRAATNGTSMCPNESLGQCRPYDDLSPWNTTIPNYQNPSIDSNSDKYMQAIKNNGSQLTSDPTQYSPIIIPVNNSTPKVTVMLLEGNYGWGNGYTYDNGDNSVVKTTTQSGVAFGNPLKVDNVPIPSDMSTSKIPVNDDAQVVFWNTDTGEEWAFWQFRPTQTTNVSGVDANTQSPNYTTTSSKWAGTNMTKYHTKTDANNNKYYGRLCGVTATTSCSPPSTMGLGGRGAGTPYFAGLIRPWEVAAGSIDHALSFAYDYPCGQFVYPAAKSDGSSSCAATTIGGQPAQQPPEGTRLQLDPSLTDSQLAASPYNLTTPAQLTVAHAMQKYGMYIIDNSGRPKINLEYSSNSNWNSTTPLNSTSFSGIPWTSFRVVTPPSVPSPPTAPTANLWVNTTAGSSPTSCDTACAYDPAKAYGSFNAAYQAALPGQTIYIRAGTYGTQQVNHKTGAASPNITIQPEPSATVKVKEFYVQSASYVTFKNFTVIPGGPDANYLESNQIIDFGAESGQTTSANHVTLDGVNLDGRQPDGTPSVRSGVGINGNTSYITIKNADFGYIKDQKLMIIQNYSGAGPNDNLVLDNVRLHDDPQSSSSIHMECLWLSSTTNSTFNRLHIYNCALPVDFSSGGNDLPVRTTTIQNSIFEASQGAGGNPGYFSFDGCVGSSGGATGSIVFKYNYFASPFGCSDSARSAGMKFIGNIGAMSSCLSTVVYNYNIWSGAKCSSTDKQISTILNAANYVRVGAPFNSQPSDYKPSSGSAPQVNAGDLTDYPATDAAGNARYSGTAPDAGPYEYQSGTTPTPKPGDTNNDNVVNIIDLSTLLSKWNTNTPAADFNKDNTVNIFDLSILLSNYGK